VPFGSELFVSTAESDKQKAGQNYLEVRKREEQKAEESGGQKAGQNYLEVRKREEQN
jgi:hypothetical protein